MRSVRCSAMECEEYRYSGVQECVQECGECRGVNSSAGSAQESWRVYGSAEECE